MYMELQPVVLEGYRQVLDTAVTQEETLESIVPDTYPDIARIVTAVGRVYVRDCEPGEGTVRLTGTIQTTVFYIPEGEQLPKTLEVAIPFQCLKDHPSLRTTTVVQSSATVTFADARAINPRKVVARAEIMVELTAYELAAKEVNTDVQGGPEGSLEKRLLPARDIVITGVVEKPFLFSDLVRMPPSKGEVQQLLLCRPQLDVMEGKLIGRKLVVKGSVKLYLVYQCGDSVTSTCFELPFSQVLDVEQEAGDQGSQVDVRLKSVDCRLREGELEVTVEACAQAVVRMEREVTLLSDVYSVSCRLDAQRSPCPLCTLAETGGTSQSVRHFYQTSVEAKQVLDSFAVVKEVTQRSGEHGNELAAQIQVHMLYLDEEGELRGATDSVLVTCPYQIPEGCQRKVHCRAVGDLTAAAVSGGIDLRFELEFRWLTTKEEELLCVSSVASTGAYEGPCSRPSLVIRRVDAGEQLWDVAKACGATIQDICTANELASETVPEGMILLIPTKRV